MREFSWLVKNYNCNSNKIEDYDVLKYGRAELKKLARKAKTADEFIEKLRIRMMSQYWSRCEYEVIIRQENDRIYILPWCGCRNPEEVKIDVTEDSAFDWKSFAEEHIGKQIYDNEAKIDVFNQLEARWNEFVKYVLFSLI